MEAVGALLRSECIAGGTDRLMVVEDALKSQNLAGTSLAMEIGEGLRPAASSNSYSLP